MDGTFHTGTLEIPETVEAWGDCGFAGNQHKTIVVGEGVTYIGNYRVFSCYNATSVMLPFTLKCIGLGAFQGCSSLSSIDIPDGVTDIDDTAFASVPLISIELPQGLRACRRTNGRLWQRISESQTPENLDAIGKASPK